MDGVVRVISTSLLLHIAHLRLRRNVSILETRASGLDKCPNGGDKAWRCLCAESLGLGKNLESIQLIDQFLFGESNHNAALLGEPLCGCDLVVVAVLAQTRPTRHDYDPLSKLESGNNGAHAGMGNHKACRFHAFPELGRVDKPLGADMFGVVV